MCLRHVRHLKIGLMRMSSDFGFLLKKFSFFFQYDIEKMLKKYGYGFFRHIFFVHTIVYGPKMAIYVHEAHGSIKSCEIF